METTEIELIIKALDLPYIDIRKEDLGGFEYKYIQIYTHNHLNDIIYYIDKGYFTTRFTPNVDPDLKVYLADPDLKEKLHRLLILN